MANFFDSVLEVLRQDNRFFAEDGQLLRNAIYEAAMQMDSNLIKLLYHNETTKKRFFTDVDGIAVFDKVGFGWVINNREFLPDSYTRYKNKIGLANDRGELISASNDVELVFPYKDCVLEGGQTKEDQKRSEIFYNETLAPEEVDRLLYPKVFTNAKRYSSDGETVTTEITKDDNLIIKGNNLLVLSSLKNNYEGRIKFIYIDVPYNTGNDSFNYNDNFDRSTWLVFMKNRLELAKKLLCSDGVILMQISFHQYAYLKVLADEIFTEKCHLFDMNTLVRHPERSLTGDKDFNDVVEYTLIYSKSQNYKMPKRVIEKTDDDYQYDFDLPSNPDEELMLGSKKVKVYLPQNVNINKTQGHPGGLKSMSIRGSIREKNSSGRFYVAYLEDKVSQYPEGTIFAVPDMGDDGRKYRIFELPKNGNKNGFYYPGKPQSSEVTYKPYPNFIDFVQEYNLVNEEGLYSFRNGKKPESYIKYYLEIFTKEKDLVLDFCLGSGTTAAVSHKLNRRYIGVEQMDYINTVAVPRLIKVIQGEDTGISKDINWQGGGSFVYCELAKLNQNFAYCIQDATDDDELSDIWDKMQKSGFISYKVNPKEIDTNAEDFKALSLDDKKCLLMELLDKNQLYVNFCDIDDEELAISDPDKAFTKSFYGEVK